MTDALQDELSEGERARRALFYWKAPDRLVTPGTISRWHKGSTYRRFPDKDQLRSLGMDAVGEGWLPAAPIISQDTRVIAIGSCFARYFVLWLAEHGYNRIIAQSPYNALLRYGTDLESPAVVAQQFRWAFGELDDKALLWIGKDKDIFQITEERRQLVRDTLLATDVLLVTLGLSEIWYDRKTGEPLWRALTVDQFDPERHVFRVETVARTLHWLETIERLRAEHVPNMKIVITVSPIRLTTTFRPVSAVSANSVSKAILRTAVDEFLRNHIEDLNKSLFYFPSYELVTDYFYDPYEHDNRHISSIVAAGIIRYFVERYCSSAMAERCGRSLNDMDGGGQAHERFIQQTRFASADARSRELLERIAELEAQVADWQKIGDDREKVIATLDQAARERLDLVHILDAEVKRLQAR